MIFGITGQESRTPLPVMLEALLIHLIYEIVREGGLRMPKSVGHAILDLGAEDFTAKAPHPVFDPGLRLKRLCQELEDSDVAVVLLDFITGPGVAYDPITAFARECAKHPDIVFISNICGSLEDPQNVEEKQILLEKSGVIVTKSNYQSTKLASALMNALERR
jgi:hypothetical protein